MTGRSAAASAERKPPSFPSTILSLLSPRDARNAVVVVGNGCDERLSSSMMTTNKRGGKEDLSRARPPPRPMGGPERARPRSQRAKGTGAPYQVAVPPREAHGSHLTMCKGAEREEVSRGKNRPDFRRKYVWNIKYVVKEKKDSAAQEISNFSNFLLKPFFFFLDQFFKRKKGPFVL